MFTRYRFSMSPLGDLRREVERLFDQFSLPRMRFSLGHGGAYPALNMWDTGEALRVEAEIPGVKQDELEIYAVGNELTVKGRRQPPSGEEQTFHRQERGTGEFSRVITLPVEVDSEKVEAVLKDGVLNICLPKAASAKPRRIAVKAN